MNSRRLKIVLAVSILLNVFILGGVAGGAYSLWSTADSPDSTATATKQRGVRFAAADLSADRQRQFRQILRDARREAAPVLQRARDGRQEVARLLSAESFDGGAVNRAMADTRAADQALRANIEGAIVDFAATLDPQERQRFTESLQGRGPLRGMAAPRKP